MADKSVADRVKELVAEQFGINPDGVTLEAKFIDDLGADSLDMVELVMAFEEEFGVEVASEDEKKIQSVGDAIKYIEERKE